MAAVALAKIASSETHSKVTLSKMRRPSDLRSAPATRKTTTMTTKEARSIITDWAMAIKVSDLRPHLAK